MIHLVEKQVTTSVETTDGVIDCVEFGWSTRQREQRLRSQFVSAVAVRSLRGDTVLLQFTTAVDHRCYGRVECPRKTFVRSEGALWIVRGTRCTRSLLEGLCTKGVFDGSSNGGVRSVS